MPKKYASRSVRELGCGAGLEGAAERRDCVEIGQVEVTKEPTRLAKQSEIGTKGLKIDDETKERVSVWGKPVLDDAMHECVGDENGALRYATRRVEPRNLVCESGVEKHVGVERVTESGRANPRDSAVEFGHSECRVSKWRFLMFASWRGGDVPPRCHESGA